MMKSSRGNRLSNAWRCPHCWTEIDARTFRLDPLDARKLICPNGLCTQSFKWKRQNKASSGRNSGPTACCGKALQG